jgi:hypothetical protein
MPRAREWCDKKRKGWRMSMITAQTFTAGIVYVRARPALRTGGRGRGEQARQSDSGLGG